MKRKLMLLLALCTIGVATAQINPTSPIPADKEVRVGKLPNGMTYYIRHNEKPKGQADFYIHHDVGAIQENDAQQGLAHFLEHMAFNGTKNLPGKMLTEYLEKVGVKFGANLNAGTSWDQTVYMIKDVPVTRQGVIDTAMLILHDWSQFIALQGDEIDSERGVIREELRTRDGASWRSTMEMIKSLGKGSKYETRNLIGHLDGLQNFKHEELVDFYHQWYRPDYQALVIVGDIDVDKVEEQIKTLMADIAAPEADASIKEVYNIPDNDAPIISIFTDPEMQGSKVQMIIKRPAIPRQYRSLVSGQLFEIIQNYLVTMENARLQEISMKPNAPFLGSGMHSGDLGVMPAIENTIFVAMAQDGKLAQGFEALYTEMEKMRRHGFTQGEFERAQNDLMRRAERGYTNRNDRTNNEFVSTYLANFSKNSPMPDAETEWKIDSTLIKMVSVEMVNQVAQQLITEKNQVILVTAPQKDGIVNPTEEEILAIRAKVAGSEIAAYEDNVVKEPLIPTTVALKGSPVAKTATNEKLGTTEWTLKNGVKIVVKPTTLKADEVRLSVVAKGGNSVLTDEEYYIGELMSSVNQMSGVGKFSATELKKQLSGKSASVRTDIGNYSSAMVGVGSPKDIETMLQLVYLNFEQPRFDQSDYDNLKKMILAQLDNAKSDPNYIAEERFIETAYGKNPRRLMISPEIINSFKFEAMPVVYKKLFPDANSFTFMFVGNVNIDELKPLVEKYIGSIKTSKTPMTFVDDKAAPVKGQVVEDFTTAMQQPKVTVRYFFTGDADFTIKEKLAMTLLTQALNARYLVSIREEKGGTYGVGVGGQTEYVPSKSYNMTIKFDTNEELADELCEIVMKEINQIANDGPKTEDIEKTREFLFKNWSNSLEQNAGWMSNIQSYYGSGMDYIGEYEKTLREITNADVQALAKKILTDGNMVKVVMRPAK